MAKTSIERLRFCNFKLKTLLDITQAINRNAPVDELLNSFKNLLSRELNIGKFVLFSNLYKQWEIWINYGINIEDVEKIDIEKDLLKIKNIEITLGEEYGNLKLFDFIIPIFKNNDVIAYVLIGDVDEEQIGISPSIQNLQFIQTLTNIIMVAIQNKELIKESFEKERMKKELEMAAAIQAMLVPGIHQIPKIPHTEITPFYMAHFEVGGDLYDIGKINQHLYYFCIADVSGKGMSAAMIMSNFQANLRALFKDKRNTHLSQMVRILNQNIISVSDGSQFVTMFLSIYNTKTKRLTYVNAGHIPPFLYFYKSKKLFTLTSGCPGIGMIDNIPKIKIGKIKISSPAKLLCFTDGLSEYPLGDNTDYGLIAIKEAMHRHELNAKETIEHIIKKLKINKDNEAIFDDITILGIDFNKKI